MDEEAGNEIVETAAPGERDLGIVAHAMEQGMFSVGHPSSDIWSRFYLGIDLSSRTQYIANMNPDNSTSCRFHLGLLIASDTSSSKRDSVVAPSTAEGVSEHIASLAQGTSHYVTCILFTFTAQARFEDSHTTTLQLHTCQQTQQDDPLR